MLAVIIILSSKLGTAVEDDLSEIEYAPLTILQVKAIVTQIDTNY